MSLSGLFAFRCPPLIPCVVHLLRLCFCHKQTRCRAGLSIPTPGFCLCWISCYRSLHKETFGSPQFPSYPFKYMPWSQNPGGVLTTRHIAFRTAAFRTNPRRRRSPPMADYPMSTTIHFSGLNTKPVPLIHSASYLRYRFCT